MTSTKTVMGKLYDRLMLLVGAVMLCLPFGSHAALTIEIVGGAAQQIPIAILPFNQPTGLSIKEQDAIANVISADLRRSGLFRVLETRGVMNQPKDISKVRYPEWAELQAQTPTIDHVKTLPDNHLKDTFHVMDVLKQTQLVGMEYNIAPN